MLAGLNRLNRLNIYMNYEKKKQIKLKEKIDKISY